jgi:hypothetical protein
MAKSQAQAPDLDSISIEELREILKKREDAARDEKSKGMREALAEAQTALGDEFTKILAAWIKTNKLSRIRSLLKPSPEELTAWVQEIIVSNGSNGKISSKALVSAHQKAFGSKTIGYLSRQSIVTKDGSFYKLMIGKG